MKRLVFAAMLAMVSPAYADHEVVDTSRCDVIHELGEYYEGYHAVVYKFEGAEALHIIGFMQALLGPMGGTPTMVWVGLNNEEQSGDFFFYDDKGCFINYVPYWLPEDINSLLEALGIAAPFGRTYYQLPNMPMARPGVNLLNGV